MSEKLGSIPRLGLTERLLYIAIVDTSVRKKVIITVLLILLFGFAVGIGAAVTFNVFEEEIGVSYGDITYTDSDLRVTDYQATGPGINTHNVDVTIENTNENDDIDANVSVYLMDGGAVISSGNTGQTTFTADGSTTVSIDVDNTKEKEYDQVDIRIEETG